MNYEEPAGHVAYMQLADAAPDKKKDELAALRGRSGYTVDVWAEFEPDCVGRFRDLDPAESNKFGWPCVYSHRCRIPGGHDRLVRVDLAGGAGGGDSFWWFAEYYLSETVIRPATLFTQPAVVSKPFARLDMDYGTGTNESGYFEFFTGRPDPIECSHFTIDFEIGVAPPRRALSDPPAAPRIIRGVIDGWLRDDDSIVLKPRGGKLTQNTWSLNDPLEPPTTAPAKQ